MRDISADYSHAAQAPLRKREAKFPTLLYYGNDIAVEPSANPRQDNWRVRLQMAKLWRDAVNKAGGNVTAHFPAVGIRGNTHVPFSDLNKLEIADLSRHFWRRMGWTDHRSTLSSAVSEWQGSSACDDSHALHLLCGNDLSAAGAGILSQVINVFSMDAPLADNHSPMALAASFP